MLYAVKISYATDDVADAASFYTDVLFADLAQSASVENLWDMTGPSQVCVCMVHWYGSRAT